MNRDCIIFSDIDGTLINDEKKITPLTKNVISQLQKKDIPFVIVSARSPSGILTVTKANDISCYIVAYSGALIWDENFNTVYENGFTKSKAKEVIDYIKSCNFDATVNFYSGDDWFAEKKDMRVLDEENTVKVKSKPGTVDDAKSQYINKILLMCNPEKTDEIEKIIKNKFPELYVAKSWTTLLEIMEKGISKAAAVEKLCEKMGIEKTNSIAFGDNFNDEPMLKAAGKGILMENAPYELKMRFSNITKDNNHDGIYFALKHLGIVE